MAIKKTITFSFILIFLGILFRATYPSHYIFGFDQVQILTNAEQIAQGDLTLIGPRTGPAEMFTGPLIYYLTAILSFIVSTPWTIVAVSTVIAVITGISIYWLTKKYLSHQLALICLAIWSFSPFLIYFDRITWNPNLTLLASYLTFLPLISIIKNKKTNRLDLFFIVMGNFLGYQAHFSGLFLPVLVIGTLLAYKIVNLKVLLASFVGVAFSLLPTVLFDIRHGWLNTKGLIKFLSDKDVVSNTPVFAKFLKSAYITLSNLGRILFFHLNKETIIFAGAVLILFCFWQIYQYLFQHKSLKNFETLKISLIWIFLTTIAFSFYSQNPPEYYFFISLPAMIVIVSLFLSQVAHNKLNKLIIIVLLAGYTGLNLKSLTSAVHMQLGHQINVVNDIQKFNLKNNISIITYDYSPDVNRIGIQYLIENQINFKEDGQIIHINKNAAPSKKYGTFGLWLDPRTKRSANYLSLSDIIVETPSNISLLEDHNASKDFHNFQVFSIFKNQENTNDKLILARKITDPFNDNKYVYSSLVESINHSNAIFSWPSINHLHYQGYVQQQENFLVIYLPDDTSKIDIDVLSQIKSFDVTSKVLYK